MAHNSTGSLLSATTQALEKVVLAPGATYSDIFHSIEEPIYLQAYGLTGDPDTDYIALEAVLVSADGNTYVDYAPAGPARFHRLTNHAILRERGSWRLRREGNTDAFVKLMVGSNIHEMPDSYWADRYNVGREGGVTSVTGQTTPSVTLTALPTTGAVSVFANVNISPDNGNTVSIRPNGVYGRGPLNGDIINVPTSVLDTDTVDHTLASNVLSSAVRLSPDAGNVIEVRTGGSAGLYVPAAAAAPIQAVNGLDTNTWDAIVTTAGSTVTVSGAVKFSPAANNQASDDGQGVWVPRGAGLGLDTSGVQTATFTPNVTLTSGVLRVSGDVRLSPDAGNIIETRTGLSAGLYVPTPAANVASLTLNDTDSVDFTSNATTGAVTASAAVKISPDAGNNIAIRTGGSAGLYVPTPASLNFATRIQSGIARFATETQVEQHTDENAANGGYVVTTESLNHIINGRNNSGFDHFRAGIDAQKGSGSEIDWPKGVFVGNEAGRNIGGYAFAVSQRPSIILGNKALLGSEVSGSIVIANATNGAYSESTVIGPSDATDVNNPFVFGVGVNSVIVGKPNSPYDLLNGVAVGNNITFASSAPDPTAWLSVNGTTFVVTVSVSHPVPINGYRVLRIIGSNPDKFVVCKYISATEFELTSVKRGQVAFDATWTSYDITGRALNCIAIGNNSSLGAGQARLGNATDITSTFLFGNVTCNGDVSAPTFTPSDSRIKKNVRPLENGLLIVEDLESVSFEYDEDSEFVRQKNLLVRPGRKIGFIAQQVEGVVPSAVNSDDDGMKGIEYSQIISALVGAVKELSARVRELESR